MKISDAVRIAAEEIGIPYEVAQKAYSMSWKFILDKIESLPLKENLTEEQFEQLRPNFNIPEIGKLTVTYDRYKRIKNRTKYIKNIKKLMQDDNEDKGNQGTV